MHAILCKYNYDQMLRGYLRWQASDNTRHRAINPSTGEPYLLPARDISRVILCSGQIYYHLSLTRRARRIRDIVLVRLEQIAPFPSDLIIKVASHTAKDWQAQAISPRLLFCLSFGSMS